MKISSKSTIFLSSFKQYSNTNLPYLLKTENLVMKVAMIKMSPSFSTSFIDLRGYIGIAILTYFVTLGGTVGDSVKSFISVTEHR